MLFQKAKKNQAGQVIIIVAGAMVGLLVVIGLAIDGGNNLLYQRKEVNAAEAGALAGTRIMCSTNQQIEAEYNQLAIEAQAEIDRLFFESIASQAKLAYLTWHRYPTDQMINDLVLRDVALNSFTDGQDGAKVTIEINRQTKTVKVIVYKDLPEFFIGLIRVDNMAQRYAVARYDCNGIIMANGAIVALDHRNGEGYWCDNALSVTGSSTDCDGAYSGNDFFDSGSDMNFGLCAFNGLDNRNINTTCSWTEAPTEPIVEDDLPVINVADYAQGSAKAIAAGTDYHYWSGNLNRNPASEVCLEQGIHYIEGDLKLNCSPAPGKYTIIVPNGTVDANTNLILNVEPYDAGILIYSGKKTACVQDAIKISVSESSVKGLIYAPWGSCQFSASGTTVVGSIICNTVKVSSSSSTFTFDDSLEAFPDSYMALAE